MFGEEYKENMPLNDWMYYEQQYNQIERSNNGDS